MNKGLLGKAKISLAFLSIALIAIFVINFVLPAFADSGSAVVWTGKADYSPEMTVDIHGSGFLPSTTYLVKVTRPDGSVVIGDGSFTPGSDTVTTDSSGNFLYDYKLDGVVGTYIVDVLDASGSVVATTTFTDSTNMTDVEMDGNIVDNVTPGETDVPTDWADLFSAAGVPVVLFPPFTATAWTNDQPKPDNSYFGLGKDISPISSWTCISQNNPADKEDILHSYAALSMPTSGLHAGYRVLYIGLERYANNGDASLGFWLLKDGTIGCSSPGTFTGAHQDGDILLVSAFTGGGSVSSIIAYQWVGGALSATPLATGADCKSVTQANPNLCASVNSVSIPTPWPTHPKSGPDNNLPDNQFFEAAVDLDAIQPGASTCFTGILGTTRSSSGTNADIKDFTRLNLNTCGTLTIVKDAVPNNAQDFSFTTTGTGLSPFSLDDDSDNTLPNTKTFTSLAPGTYLVSETPVTNWIQTSAICSDGSEVSAISIQAGETVTCTFTNTLQQGHLIVYKTTIPSDTTTPFSITANGDTRTIYGGGSQDYSLDAGTYSVTESPLIGWSEDVSDCQDKVVTSGQTTTCTVVNTKLPTLTVTKTLVPNSDSGKFNLRIDSTTYASNVGDGGTTGAQIVSIGAHTVDETAGTSTSLSDYITVIGGNCVSDGTITLTAGDVKTCTITNTKKPKLTVTKIVVNNNGGTKVVADFPLFVDSNPVTSGVQNIFSIGAHTVSETPDSGYTETITGDCASDGSITLAAGDVKSCTITNDDKPAHLIVIKHVVNDNGGNNAASDFTMTINGVSASGGNSFAGAESPGVDKTLTSVGSYSVTETGSSGYTESDSTDCSGTIALGQTKTCTITNDDQPAHITLIKSVTNNNGGTAGVNDFGIKIDGNVVSSSSTTDVNSNTAHTINENGLTGYAFVSITGNAKCPAALGGNTANLNEGESITCTITNDDIQPKLTVTKVVQNNYGGTLTVSSFPLLVDATPVTSGVQAGFNAGTYTVSETQQTGYELVGITGDCATDGSITLHVGDVKSCTITDRDIQPLLTVTKVVHNLYGGTKVVADFTLKVGATTVTSGVQNGFNAGTYTVSEDPVSGYTGTISGDCNPTTGSVTLVVGDVKSCQIDNYDIQPKLHVIKHVVNDNGGTAVAGDFDITVTGTSPSPSTFDGVESPGTLVMLNAGSYNVDEAAFAGYAKSRSTDCSGTIVVGDEKTCTITNDDIAPKLTLVKTVTNNDGGQKVVADFPLFINGNPVTSGVQNTLIANVLYTASETPDSGYTASVWGTDCASDGTITLQPGDDKTCTITNDDKPAHLIVIKHVINDNGGTKTASDFSITVTGTNVQSSATFAGAESPGTEVTLNAGSYSVDESAVAGYAKTLGTDCSGTIANGQTKTCTITNDDIQPKLHVIKHVVNDNGGNNVAPDWTMSVTGSSPSPASFAGSESGTLVMLNTGSYSVGESGPSGYTESDSTDCSGTMAVGDEKTCTITNDDQPAHITLIKSVTNNNGGTAGVNDFGIKVDGNVVSSGSTTDVNSNTAHTINENGLTGYSFVSITGDEECPDVLGGSVTLNEGEHITCTINNDDIQPLLTVTKIVNNNHGGTLTVSSFPLLVDLTSVTSGVQGGFDAGTYTVSETQQTGYELVGITGDCATDGSITLHVGDVKTCTITDQDIAPQLTIIKHVINDDGGTATADQWTIHVTATNPSSNDFAGAESPGTTITVDQGAYSVDETSGPSGYAKTLGTDCSGTINVGDSKTCTITNDDIQPKLTVTKTVHNNYGGTKVVSDFNLYVDTTQVTSGQQNGYDVGTYTVSEDPVSGYTGTIGGDCASDGTVSLSVGDVKECTIDNYDIQPLLTVTKVVINDNGGNKVVADFPLFVGATSVTSGIQNGFNAGAYSVSETSDSGYTETITGDCASDGSITLAVGDVKSCTITNDDQPAHLIVIKHVINDNSGTSTASDFTMTINGVTASGGNSFAGAESPGVDKTLTSVGSYSVTETGSSGYTESDSTDCSGTISLGQTKTCTITNDDIQPITRTQGFWATHTTFTSYVFNTLLSSSMPIGTAPHKGTLTTTSQLFGAFYASIPKTTTGAKRSSLDKARMQLLQQLVAAKLNCAAFTCSGSIQTTISNADNAYATGTESQVLSYASQLDAYNNAGDGQPFPSGLPAQGSATPKTSQSIANLVFWNSP